MNKRASIHAQIIPADCFDGFVLSQKKTARESY